MRNAARFVLWCAVVYVIAVGLQACAAKKPVHRSKFDSPKYNLNKTHKRWP